jgi:hypothetical protein
MFAGFEDQPFKLITSGGAVVLPVIQQMHKLDLEPIPVKGRANSSNAEYKRYQRQLWTALSILTINWRVFGRRH